MILPTPLADNPTTLPILAQLQPFARSSTIRCSRYSRGGVNPAGSRGASIPGVAVEALIPSRST
jgi:hypothetical protein